MSVRLSASERVKRIIRDVLLIALIVLVTTGPLLMLILGLVHRHLDPTMPAWGYWNSVACAFAMQLGANTLVAAWEGYGR